MITDAVSKVIAEGNALTRALAVVEDGVSTDEARRLCSIYLVHHAVDTLENCAIDCALRKICGVPPVTYNLAPVDPPEDLGALLFRTGVRTWMQWVRQSAAMDVADELGDTCRGDSPTTDIVRSAFDVMALTHWVVAVDNLRRGNLQTGRRYFRRATVLGGEYGTVSNPVIQWTYAASFFPGS